MGKSLEKCANIVRTWIKLDKLVSHLILQFAVQISITQLRLHLSVSLSLDRNHILGIN